MKKSIILCGVVLFCCGIVIAQDIPQEGLVAYYKFDEDGDYVIDHSGNGLDGIIEGDPIWVEGFTGNGLYFDGIDDYVNCTNAPDFDIVNEITLMAWVRPYDLNDTKHSPWVAKGDHAYNLKNGNGPYKIEFDIYDGGWIWMNVFVDSTYTDTWHHYAATYDGSEQKMFVDGEMLASQEHVGTINVTEHEVHLGHNSEASDRYFNGILDEVLIYDIALSDDDIKAIYNSYVTAVEDQSARELNDFALQQNYPNPFNSETTIRYSVKESGLVQLNIYSTTGQLVRTLVNEKKPSGDYFVKWDGKDGSGELVSSGVYFYTLQFNNHNYIYSRMVFLK
jgi:hypothetical protein